MWTFSRADAATVKGRQATWKMPRGVSLMSSLLRNAESLGTGDSMITAISAFLMAVSLKSDEIDVKVIAGLFSTVILLAHLACAVPPNDNE